MAILSNLLEEEDQKAIATRGTPASGVIQAVPTTGAPTSGGGQPATTGTGFVNLEKYLQANQGAQTGLAKAVGAEMKDSGTFAKELEQAQAGYGSEAEKAKQQIEQQGAEAIAGLEKSPTAAYQKAKTLASESFAGPSGDIYQAQVKAAQAAQEQNIKRLGTAEAQQDVLEKTFAKKPGYTKGYSLLDQYLLSRSPEAQALLAQQRTEAEAATKTAGETAIGNIAKAQQDVLTAKQKQQEAIKGTARQQKKGKLEKAALDIEGRNIGLAKRVGAKEASYGDVLSNEQIADIRALADLAGEQITDNLERKTYAYGEAPERGLTGELGTPTQWPTQDERVTKIDPAKTIEEKIKQKAKIPDLKLPEIKGPKLPKIKTPKF